MALRTQAVYQRHMCVRVLTGGYAVERQSGRTPFAAVCVGEVVLSGKATASRSVQDTPAAGSAGGEAIDRDYLARFTLGNAALEREVLELFAAQLPLYVRQLKDAQTVSAWREAAHTIKGSAAAVGARRLANIARMAEQLDIESAIVLSAGQRAKAIAVVAQAADEACRFIACLFATP